MGNLCGDIPRYDAARLSGISLALNMSLQPCGRDSYCRCATEVAPNELHRKLPSCFEFLFFFHPSLNSSESPIHGPPNILHVQLAFIGCTTSRFPFPSSLFFLSSILTPSGFAIRGFTFSPVGLTLSVTDVGDISPAGGRESETDGERDRPSMAFSGRLPFRCLFLIRLLPPFCPHLRRFWFLQSSQFQVALTFPNCSP